VDVHNCFLPDLPLLIHIFLIPSILNLNFLFLAQRRNAEVTEIPWYLLIKTDVDTFETFDLTVVFQALLGCLECVVGLERGLVNFVTFVIKLVPIVV